MKLQHLITRSIFLTLIWGGNIWASTAAVEPASAIMPTDSSSEPIKSDVVATPDVKPTGDVVAQPSTAELKKIKVAQKAEAAKKARAEKKAAAVQVAKANIPNALERAKKVLEKVKKEEENTNASALSSEKEKDIAQKSTKVAEEVVNLEQIKKEILDLDSSSTAKEEDKKVAQDKLKIAAAALAAAETALEEAKKSKKTPVATDATAVVAPSIADPKKAVKTEEAFETKATEEKKKDNTGIAKQKKGKVGSNPQNPEEAYTKAKENIEKLVSEARNNPALKRKLEEAASKLKELEQALQNAQATLDVAIKGYHKVKDDPNAAEVSINAVTNARVAALEQVKKINADLKKEREAYESLIHETETTKQLRDREHKRALSLKTVRERELKKAEADLLILDARMDRLMANPKSKDKDLSDLERDIEQAYAHLDKREKKWEEIKREVALTKLRSETVVERCTRERDRTKERLEALQGRLKSKKGKNFEAQLAFIRKALTEKERELRAAQKRKDAKELDIAAIAFDPNDPIDEEILEQEITTPEERAAAKKAFSQLLQNYRTAKKNVNAAEKDLTDAEKEYLNLKSQNRSKDAAIKAITRKLKRLQFSLIHAIRAELRAKKAYEIALRQTETLKETRLRTLRELEILVKSLEQRFIDTKQALTEAQTALTQAQSAKSLDKKVVELAAQKVTFAKTRIARINQDKELAYKALKIAQEKAAIYLTADSKEQGNKGHRKKHVKRRGARDTFLAGSNEEELQDLEEDQEYEDLEEAPLVYRDESEEDQQAVAELESANAELEKIDDEASIAGQIINAEIRLERQEANEGSTTSSSEEDLPIATVPTTTFDSLAGDREDNDSRSNNNLNVGAPTSLEDNSARPSTNASENGAEYLIPSGRPSEGETLGAGGEMEPSIGEDRGDNSFEGNDMEKQRLEDEAEAQQLTDEEETLRLAEEEEAGILAEEEEQRQLMGELASDDGDKFDASREEPTNSPTSLPNDEGELSVAPSNNDIINARQDAEQANNVLESAMETGDRSKIINAQIDKEAADIKLAKAQIEQSPYGREIKSKEQNSWENAYGKDLFDPEAPDKGGIFNAKPATSENVSDIVMEGSSLTKPDHLIERPRAIVLERTGSSASVTNKLNADLPVFHPDTGIGSL